MMAIPLLCCVFSEHPGWGGVQADTSANCRVPFINELRTLSLTHFPEASPLTSHCVDPPILLPVFVYLQTYVIKSR